ncbi:hypothetical protein TVAG_202750 [Trichomonas vaginalis G3]|uniref:Uncharacterized protein n=1 Tax=Trichomonas vaginalis (strain ATCC PRA-98 / G3) TaxID=412133 RepID=A2ENE7_TRIV3|nr:hypothetical protein TVAGG3_0490920 [Trichomonas vaginalis G3]EAY05817.1 hypothetical protein TVAG_202750 [Trichomonas vaginalis G3]KAI5516369.1 hypothetical protein TVAGG3_0490920 [Trichomonas vaginalis G3]|eukprot:XP_001318040.1 hypothetical protein [Trichomonas vaginalis G3]
MDNWGAVLVSFGVLIGIGLLCVCIVLTCEHCERSSYEPSRRRYSSSSSGISVETAAQILAVQHYQKQQAKDIIMMTKELIDLQDTLNSKELQAVLNVLFVLIQHLEELQRTVDGLRLLDAVRNFLVEIHQEVKKALSVRRRISVAIIERNGNQIRGILAQIEA